MGLLLGRAASTPLRIQPPAERGEPVPAAAGDDRQNSAFVTPQSLLTFSGMTVGVSVIWAGLEAVFGWPHRLWLGFAIAILFGAVLLYDDLRDPKRAPEPRTGIRILCAVVNTFFLFNAAAGGYDLVAKRDAKPPVAAGPPATQSPPPPSPPSGGR